MENVHSFLKSSTIHGLSYISSTKRLLKLFWTLVVLSGFTGAGLLIYESFQSWAESPITTTIETLPIKDITFPKISVCPPENTFTDLNYDLIKTKKVTLDEVKRENLTNFAVELINEAIYEETLANLNKIKEKNRLNNWYKKYTKIEIPFYGEGNRFNYNITTSDTDGSISSQDFGENFNATKMETNFHYSIKIYPPNDVVNNTNVTLDMTIDRVPLMNNLNDKIKILNKWGSYKILDTIKGKSIWRFSPPGIIGGENFKKVNDFREIIIERKISTDEVRALNYHRMPGFNVSWYYKSTNYSTVSNRRRIFNDEANVKVFSRYVSYYNKIEVRFVCSKFETTFFLELQTLFCLITRAVMKKCGIF